MTIWRFSGYAKTATPRHAKERTRLKLSVIIPTWQAADFLPTLIPTLRQQSTPPDEIIIIDSSSPDDTATLAVNLGCTVLSTPKAAFNHGGTRNQAAEQADGDILVFMTQDALPADETFLEHLVQPIIVGTTSATYARQIAPDEASPLEKFARTFNYPPTSHTKTLADLERMGVKTYFFSDVASALSATAFRHVGGYPDWVIVNEDMVLCAKLLQAGHTIAYQAEACVYHGHDYSLLKLFRRYFDIGVFMQQANDVLVGATSGGAGLSFATGQIRYLWQNQARLWIPRSVIETGLKFVAFHLGKRSGWLPLTLKQRLSGHPTYWKR